MGAVFASRRRGALLGGLLALVLLRTEATPERIEGAVYVIATYLLVNGYLRNIGWQVRNAQRALNELDNEEAAAAVAKAMKKAFALIR